MHSLSLLVVEKSCHFGVIGRIIGNQIGAVDGACPLHFRAGYRAATIAFPLRCGRAGDFSALGIAQRLTAAGIRRVITKTFTRRHPRMDDPFAALQPVRLRKGGLPVSQAALSSPYDRNIRHLAFLAPDIQQAIPNERQSHISTLRRALTISTGTDRCAAGAGRAVTATTANGTGRPIMVSCRGRSDSHRGRPRREHYSGRPCLSH